MEHIIQENNSGCAIAAIAMVTYSPYEEIQDLAVNCDIDIDNGLTTKQIKYLLMLCGYFTEDIPTVQSAVRLGPARYIGVIMSLNSIGGQHCIALEVQEDGTVPGVFDPNFEREGVNFLTPDTPLEEIYLTELIAVYNNWEQ